MTLCDLAAITKPWPIQKKVARLVSAEFLYQGDLEKKQLNLEPIDMMNREKMDRLPAMQVDFIDSICLPVYKSFSKLSDALDPLLEGCMDNRREWERLSMLATDCSKSLVDDDEEAEAEAEDSRGKD